MGGGNGGGMGGGHGGGWGHGGWGGWGHGIPGNHVLGPRLVGGGFLYAGPSSGVPTTGAIGTTDTDTIPGGMAPRLSALGYPA